MHKTITRGLLAVALIAFALSAFVGCSSGNSEKVAKGSEKVAKGRSLVGDWSCWFVQAAPNHHWYTTFYEDGTCTVSDVNGHENWRLDGDEIHITSYHGELEGQVEWSDDNHCVIGGNSLIPANYTRVCEETKHGDQYY